MRIALEQCGLGLFGAKYHGPRSIPLPDREGMSADMLASIYDIEEMREACLSGAPIGGHIWTRSAIEAGYSTILGVLREPRSRVLSLYRYWQAEDPEILTDRFGAKGKFVLRATRGDFREFLEEGLGQVDVDNGVANYLEGVLDLSRAERKGMDIRFYWTSELDVMVASVGALMGREQSGSGIEVGTFNETKVVGEPEVLDGPTMKLLNDRTRADRRLIARAMQRGWVSKRSRRDLDAEFLATQARLGFSRC